MDKNIKLIGLVMGLFLLSSCLPSSKVQDVGDLRGKIVFTSSNKKGFQDVYLYDFSTHKNKMIYQHLDEYNSGVGDVMWDRKNHMINIKANKGDRMGVWQIDEVGGNRKFLYYRRLDFFDKFKPYEDLNLYSDQEGGIYRKLPSGEKKELIKFHGLYDPVFGSPGYDVLAISPDKKYLLVGLCGIDNFILSRLMFWAPLVIGTNIETYIYDIDGHRIKRFPANVGEADWIY